MIEPETRHRACRLIRVVLLGAPMERGRAPIRILLADDHVIFRSGLRNLLDREPGFKVVGEARDVAETTKFVRETAPDILLIDLQMPGVTGTEFLRQLSSNGRKMRTLVLTAANAKNEIEAAFRLGVRGVVLKDSSTKVLIQGIHSVMSGKFWVADGPVSRLGSESLQPAHASSAQMPTKTFGLTGREMEIVTAIVSGYSNREIAAKLDISEDTVKHHVTNVFDKLGVFNRLELALFAIHHGLAGRHQRQAKTRLQVSLDVA